MGVVRIYSCLRHLYCLSSAEIFQEIKCLFSKERSSLFFVIFNALLFYSFALQLGLVVDLTNTSRYYSVADLKKEGIKHVKVCPGQLLCINSGSCNVIFILLSLFCSYILRSVLGFRSSARGAILYLIIYL